jgi:asparagine synthase (glutamine-hydrolysing)
MCGIVGFWRQPEWSDAHLKHTIQQMNESFVHRGPDGHGRWCDAAVGLALGHRRLAIQDLSPKGQQPMVSASGRYVIVFNGEVYNSPALRGLLEQSESCLAWRGHSDTETMLACIEKWGLEKAVNHFIGMFAFALWDKKKRTLRLIRDRLGIKPLYYGFQRGVFLFGSELKALRAHPAFQNEIDRHALSLFFRHNVIPAPYSIYQGIKKLPPGMILTLSRVDEEPLISSYWDAWEVVERGQTKPFLGSYEDAVDELESLLRDSVSLRLLSDVPVGVFLSGGIDSSTVAALMQSQCSQPVRSFSIGFSETIYNEAPYAAAIAEHLETDHTELTVTPQQALDLVPHLSSIYDEPFADASQVPTSLLSQLTRQYVNVALSGDGGDELFAGYNRHVWGEKLWQRISGVPRGLRQLIGWGMTRLPEGHWNLLSDLVQPCLPSKWKVKGVGRHVHNLALQLQAGTPQQFYRSIASHWSEPEALAFQSTEPPTSLTQQRQPQCASFTEWMMAQDLVTYLPDDILTKVDRASMAFSLEARVPMLDHRVVEFAWQLPLAWKLQGLTSKRILRDVLGRYVPRELFERPKMGFGVPIEHWLRHELRDWAEDLLDETKLRQQGFLNSAPIRQKWQEHLSGKLNWQDHLWDVLMWQAWLQNQD